MRMSFSMIWKLVLLLILSAVLPLALFGMISLTQARSTAHQSVIVGNQRIAARAAAEIDQYVEGTLAILKSVGENIKRADLEDWQRQRVIRNMSLEFREFTEITLFDGAGRAGVTSAVGTPHLPGSPLIGKAIDAAKEGREYISEVFITDELTPAMVAAFPLVQLGSVTSIVVGEIDLLHMWRMVGSIRVGQSGYLNVVLPDGKLIASGSGEMKKLVLQELDYPDMPLLARLSGGADGDPAYAYRDGSKGRLLISAARLPPPLGWMAVVEQPLGEAYALEQRMTWQLALLVAVFVVVMFLIGFFGVRWQIIGPIRVLIGGTRAVAMGDLDHRVQVHAHDEFGELASSFNRMTGDLKQMQDNIRRQERMAMFGRIASGLVHDLKHPVTCIENASKLMERMHDDPDYRATFRKTVDREFEKINGFLANLHTLTHDIPYHPIRIKVRQLIEDVTETFRAQAESGGVVLDIAVKGDDLMIHADKISVGRALSNIVINGIQAMPDGGTLRVTAERFAEGTGAWVRLVISDSGVGIPPERLETVFGDFVTTKRRGLGLGLALTKRILDQHGATIAVTSVEGTGTTFDIRFPISD